MSGNISTSHSLDNTATSRTERVKQARQLLTLLIETEQTIHRDPDIASTYLNQAIALLAVDNQREHSPHKHRGGLPRWQISRVDTFINEHIDKCIRTTELASLLGLSVSHFSHVFKQTTGITPLMYVAAARVEAARRFMLCSTHSLSDVALGHGFCDQSHFCRVFRRETGLSPQTWRRLNTPNTRLRASSLSSSTQQTAQVSTP
ncbi:helix-turn-helix domain-containing protein [Pseudomonas sp.]|uniref:helix-turn-helix domain-containing protein n=1 Tax=Pseudomonas sp. TaxID=306 RepID=UPI003A9749F1